MNLLTAPHTQDPRHGGFTSTVPGELLVRGTVCDAGREGRCGCERSWCGLSSSKGTTIAAVVDHPITEDTYLDLVTGYLTDIHGWDPDHAEHEAQLLAELANDYPAGTLLTLELNGDQHTFLPLET